MILLIVPIILFLALRLINLNIIPVFADEAIYIHWAQIAWHDHTQRFISLTDGKPPLHTWLMIPFLKIINDPLVAGRLLSVVAGSFTLIGVYLITHKLFNKHVALFSSLLIFCSPFLVFYDRLAVADSLLTAFGVWSFYLGLNLIEKPDLGKSFLLGFCWVGGLLTKQPGLYFIVLFPTLLFLTKKVKYNFFPFVLISTAIAILGYNVIKLSPYSHLISVRSYDYILGKREFLEDPFRLLWGNLQGIFYWLFSYQTIFSFILFIIGLIFLLKDNWKKFLVILFWIIVPIVGSAAIGKIIFPRYFLLVQPWITLVIAYSIDSLAKRVFVNKILKTLFFLFSFVPWLYFSTMLIFAPQRAPLIKREQDQYLTTWSSGYGIKEVADYLKNNYANQKVFVATEGYFGTLPDGLMIYLDKNKNINIYGVGQPLDDVPEDTIKNASISPTFLVINSTRYNGSRKNLTLIKEYQKPIFSFLDEKLLFFRVVPNEN